MFKPNVLICTGFTLAANDKFWIKQINPVVTQTDIAMNLYACNYTGSYTWYVGYFVFFVTEFKQQIIRNIVFIY